MIHTFSKGDLSTILTNGALFQGLVAVFWVRLLKRMIYTKIFWIHKETFTKHKVDCEKSRLIMVWN